ncbi:MAG: hypothetical protein AAGB31_11580 [Bdellovibrio sp.]
MRVRILTKILFVCVCLSGGKALAQDSVRNCERNQGVVELGSGTTKVYAAVVDVCKKTIVRVLHEERFPLAFKEAVEKSETKEIPSAVQQEAENRLVSVRAELQKKSVSEIKGIATAVFRVAKNGSAVIKALSQKGGFAIEIISQKREAELGFWSVLASKNINPQEPVAVWDIGGGSMQMYSRQGGKEYVYEGHLASVSYKNQVMETLQFKDPRKEASPNPIGVQREAALQLAKNHAYLHVPEYFKEKSTSLRWFGVGGVLSLSVQRQTVPSASEFTQKELNEVAARRVLLKDAEINSDYRVSDISNLLLVLGYMQALKIDKVETLTTSLGAGWVYNSLHSEKTKH